MSGEELRRRREALQLSQPKLAEALGVHPNTIWRWEHSGVPVRQMRVVSWDLGELEHQAGLPEEAVEQQG